MSDSDFFICRGEIMRRQDLSLSARVVLCYVSGFGDRGCFASQPATAGATGVPERSVRRALDELFKAGLVQERVALWNGRKRQGMFAVNPDPAILAASEAAETGQNGQKTGQVGQGSGHGGRKNRPRWPQKPAKMATPSYKIQEHRSYKIYNSATAVGASLASPAAPTASAPAALLDSAPSNALDACPPRHYTDSIEPGYFPIPDPGTPTTATPIITKSADPGTRIVTSLPPDIASVLDRIRAHGLQQTRDASAVPPPYPHKEPGSDAALALPEASAALSGERPVSA